jgi:hypothetical protein
MQQSASLPIQVSRTLPILVGDGQQDGQLTSVYKHNILMKDFPLDELLAATDLEKVQEAVVLIFAHVNKKLKLS